MCLARDLEVVVINSFKINKIGEESKDQLRDLLVGRNKRQQDCQLSGQSCGSRRPCCETEDYAALECKNGKCIKCYENGDTCNLNKLCCSGFVCVHGRTAFDSNICVPRSSKY